jgi:uncharacterized protein YqgC (DUF456 family)
MEIVYQILFVFLYIVLAVVMLLTAIGLPGNWILVGVAAIIGLITKFDVMTWGWLLACVGLATLGEIIESALGAVVVASRGGTRWGVIGSIVGGFAGVILGASVVPPFGSVILGFVGAFAGAVLGEMYKQRQVEPALRIGFWSVIGKVMSMAGKLLVGTGILVIIIYTTWP